MKVTVVGIQKVDYVKKNGEPCKGVTLHTVFKDGQVTGDAVDTIFVNDNLDIACLYDVAPGMEVDIAYNRRGYVADVSIVG